MIRTLYMSYTYIHTYEQRALCVVEFWAILFLTLCVCVCSHMYARRPVSPRECLHLPPQGWKYKHTPSQLSDVGSEEQTHVLRPALLTLYWLSCLCSLFFFF